jgi:hypothetical protein
MTEDNIDSNFFVSISPIIERYGTNFNLFADNVRWHTSKLVVASLKERYLKLLLNVPYCPALTWILSRNSFLNKDDLSQDPTQNYIGRRGFRSLKVGAGERKFSE